MNLITFDLENTYRGGRKIIHLDVGLRPYSIEVPDEPIDRVAIMAGESSIGIHLKKFLKRLGDLQGENVTPNGAPDVRRVVEVYSGEIEIPPYVREMDDGHFLDGVIKIIQNGLACQT